MTQKTKKNLNFTKPKCSRNFIKGINTLTVTLIRYSGQGRYSTDGRNQEIDDDTPGLTPEI